MSKSTLAERAYRSIKDRIVTYQLLPGAPLHEEELSQELQISRTPVREALRLLESEGLVEIQPRRGARVATTSRQDLLDAYEIRMWVEPAAAAKVALNADSRVLATLEAILAGMPAEPATHAEAVLALQTDLDFHRVLVESAGNRLACNVVAEARAITQRAAYFVPPGRYSQSREEHRAILEAVRNRDADAAERLMRTHLQAAANRMFLQIAAPGRGDGRQQ